MKIKELKKNQRYYYAEAKSAWGTGQHLKEILKDNLEDDIENWYISETQIGALKQLIKRIQTVIKGIEYEQKQN